MTSQANQSPGENDANADRVAVAVADGAVSSTPDGSGHTHDTAPTRSIEVDVDLRPDHPILVG